ncbi:DUF6913 domain-containing protein [Flavobacterium sp.]|uniref:DUF6913 domain-containing protein n=1 Tax=Flavobacterium sp. TaxID=239 RepID=UPI00375376BB
MFLKYIKELSVKKLLKSTLKHANSNTFSTPIKTVGLLIDESYFQEKEQLKQLIVQNGIKENNIKIIVFKDKIKKNDVYQELTFSNKNMNWKGVLKKDFINDFINTPFDMLISYYDVEKAPLLIITHNSRANFKVGISKIDTRLNNLMINTTVENYTVFTEELFKYLKILKKI